MRTMPCPLCIKVLVPGTCCVHWVGGYKVYFDYESTGKMSTMVYKFRYRDNHMIAGDGCLMTIDGFEVLSEERIEKLKALR